MLEKFMNWLTDLGFSTLDRFLPFLLILLTGILVIRIVMAILTKALEKGKLEKAAHGLIKSVARIVMYGILALIAASSLGIDVTGVVALASVVSLALSLALQNSLANVIGGFVLLYTHPFSSGDYVEVAGQAGTVQEIGMAYTKLTTPDNKMISIPNNAVVAAEIVNYTVTGTRRLDVKIHVARDVPAEKVLKAVQEAVDVPQALEENGIFTAITGYSEKGVEYMGRIWTRSGEYWDAVFLTNRRLKEIFDREGLEVSYPHVDVHLNKGDKA